MEWLEIWPATFPVSGVTTSLVLPPLVAFAISFFTSMAGVSGAFMLLPFQMTALGYTAPSVSGTNQVFNIVAIPSGVWRYIREGRMVWPLTWAVIAGTLPGVFAGAWIRVEYLPDPRHFKLFAAALLAYIGLRLLRDGLKKAPAKSVSAPATGTQIVRDTRFSWREVRFSFGDVPYRFSLPGVMALCLVVGAAGGIYGIGGGSIISPFFVSILELPVHAVAGACLMGTFITSVAGVAFYHVLALWRPDVLIAPDWLLGGLFGAGGFAGMYLGARCQKWVSPRAIKILLCFCVLFVAIKYIMDFFG